VKTSVGCFPICFSSVHNADSFSGTGIARLPLAWSGCTHASLRSRSTCCQVKPVTFAARKPVDPDTTLFRPGSISKLFTWTAVMQLVEAGKLDLDADVNRYLDFRIPPRDGQPVTLRELMTHTPGFEEHLTSIFGRDPASLFPLRDFERDQIPARLYPPGRIPAYSNYGAGLAGYIVQRVSCEPFETYIERHIFAPLGMTHASFRQPLPASAKFRHGIEAPLYQNGTQSCRCRVYYRHRAGLLPGGQRRNFRGIPVRLVGCRI